MKLLVFPESFLSSDLIQYQFQKLNGTVIVNFFNESFIRKGTGLSLANSIQIYLKFSHECLI